MSKQRWTAEELALLASMYPECHSEDVAAWLGRSVGKVYQAANLRGIRKSAAYLASPTAGRMDARRADHPNMVACRFKRGQAAWNKGRPGSETGTGTHPNSRRTQFKADGSLRGAAQHNYQPIGSLRLSADGYLERKVTDDHPVPARRWVAVHRLVWEAEVGPIPKGHIVRFKAGQKTAVLEQITADRLECITRAENATRNHPRNRDPELGRLVQLKGAITRQVNRIAREAQEQHA